MDKLVILALVLGLCSVILSVVNALSSMRGQLDTMNLLHSFVSHINAISLDAHGAMDAAREAVDIAGKAREEAKKASGELYAMRHPEFHWTLDCMNPVKKEETDE